MLKEMVLHYSIIDFFLRRRPLLWNHLFLFSFPLRMLLNVYFLSKSSFKFIIDRTYPFVRFFFRLINSRNTLMINIFDSYIMVKYSWIIYEGKILFLKKVSIFFITINFSLFLSRIVSWFFYIVVCITLISK